MSWMSLIFILRNRLEEVTRSDNVLHCLGNSKNCSSPCNRRSDCDGIWIIKLCVNGQVACIEQLRSIHTLRVHCAHAAANLN